MLAEVGVVAGFAIGVLEKMVVSSRRDFQFFLCSLSCTVKSIVFRS